MNLSYYDVDDVVDMLVAAALLVLIIEWFAQTGSDSTGYTARSQGDGPLVLGERAFDHLADGGSIEVDRWHGGTLTIEAYQTVDVDGETGG